MSDQSTAYWASVPVIPSFAVNDPQASIAWFEHLGFQPKSVMRMPDGAIMHAELARGDLLIMLGPAMCNAPGSTGMSLYINARDISVDALYDRVKDKVEVTQQPDTMFWGDRIFAVRHPDGYSLTFFEHVRDVTEEEMAEHLKQCAAAQVPA